MTIHYTASALLLGAGLVLALIALALYLRGLRQRRLATGFLDRAVTTTAEVIEMEAKDVALRSEPDTRYFPRVRFTLDGRTIEAESMTDSAMPPPRVGDQIEIVYDPERPERLDLVARSDRADGAGRTSFLMAGLVLAVALATPVAWLVLVVVVWSS